MKSLKRPLLFLFVLAIVFILISLASCTRSGMYYNYRYMAEGDTLYFADERYFEFVDSIYILPKRRSKAERFQHLIAR